MKNKRWKRLAKRIVGTCLMNANAGLVCNNCNYREECDSFCDWTNMKEFQNKNSYSFSLRKVEKALKNQRGENNAK